MEFNPRHTKITVVGLGYVGLPLAAAFSKKFPTIGYDIDKEKVDVYKELKDFGLQVDVHDPNANAYQVHKEYGISLIEDFKHIDYEVILLAVAHDQFKDLQIKTTPQKVVYDLKGILPRTNVDKRL